MLLRTALFFSLAVAVLLAHGVHGQGASSAAGPAGPPATVAVSLLPTQHPPLPDTLDGYWLVSGRGPTVFSQAGAVAADRLTRGVALIASGEFAAGLPLVRTTELSNTVLASYAQYYTAVALIGVQRLDAAEAVLAALAARQPEGALRERLPERIAELALARNDPARAVEWLQGLSEQTRPSPEPVWLQLGAAAEQAGDIEAALAAYRRIYYEFPLSPQAVDAQAAIARLETPDRIAADRVRLELDRAQRLFAARNWIEARAGFERVRQDVTGDDATLVALRLAQTDYYRDRFTAARNGLAPLLGQGPLQAEARLFHLSAVRGLRAHAEYERLVRRFVDDHPDSSRAEDALDDLATHYIRTDDLGAADGVFREILTRYPQRRVAERAAWRVGWRAYRAGNFLEAAETFERGAATFPRADNRPAWLYWSGRSRAQLGEHDLAEARYRVAIADYGNSYYGRLAASAMGPSLDVQRVAAAIPPQGDGARAAERIPTETLIRELVAVGLYDDALREVQYAQRTWGDSSRLQATAAYIRHMQARTLNAQDRFTALRGAITTMRRAYPQFMAAGGEQMPPDILRIIFPLDYWPLITKYSEAQGLDPYLIAALMAQESTFTAEIRSSANAIGLMQIIPATGRRYAQKLGIRNFSTASLTQPETNIRLGTLYFRELVDRFGGVHYALAGYNAGESRVARWRSERPSLPPDEFVEEIPFPETQNYVKRILGTAEDYRYLYGSGLIDPVVPRSASAGSHEGAYEKPRRSDAREATKITKTARVQRPSS